MTVHIGDKIKFLRDSKGMSIQELSESLGFKTTNTIIMIESGETSPSIDKLEKIAYALGVSFIDLYSTNVPEDHVFRKKVSILGQKLHKERVLLGHSISAVAKAAEIAELGIKRLEAGSSQDMSASSVFALSRVLQVPLEYLLDDSMPVRHNG